MGEPTLQLASVVGSSRINGNCMQIARQEREKLGVETGNETVKIH